MTDQQSKQVAEINSILTDILSSDVAEDTLRKLRNLLVGLPPTSREIYRLLGIGVRTAIIKAAGEKVTEEI